MGCHRLDGDITTEQILPQNLYSAASTARTNGRGAKAMTQSTMLNTTGYSMAENRFEHLQRKKMTCTANVDELLNGKRRRHHCRSWGSQKLPPVEEAQLIYHLQENIPRHNHLNGTKNYYSTVNTQTRYTSEDGDVSLGIITVTHLLQQRELFMAHIQPWKLKVMHCSRHCNRFCK